MVTATAAQTMFVSHASEDKDAVAGPLARELLRRGYTVWYDDYTLEIGDSLRSEIDRGLTDCDFGIVVLSPNFFRKGWTRVELDGLLCREAATGSKIVLPVWHDVTKERVQQYSAILAGKLAVSTAKGIPLVVDSIERAVHKASLRGRGHTHHGSGGAVAVVPATPTEVAILAAVAMVATAVLMRVIEIVMRGGTVTLSSFMGW